MNRGHDVQPMVQQIAQSDAARTEGGPSATSAVSGSDSQPVIPNASGRDRAGRFVPGHRINISTGSDTERLPVGLEQLQHQIDTFINGCLADEADDDLPTRRKALLEYRARLHRRIIQLDAVLETRGLLDRRQKLRTQWLSMLCTLIEKARALDVTLGLERRQKDIGSMDLQTWLQQGGNHGDPPDDSATEPRADQNSHEQTETEDRSVAEPDR